MTVEKETLQSGVNFGGWLFQYPAFDYDYFDRFINASDIRRIADWGCDHIRLPVDYPLLEIENQPGTLNERGLEYILRCLAAGTFSDDLAGSVPLGRPGTIDRHRWQLF